MRLAKRFDIESKELTLYRDKDSNEIVIIARKPLKEESFSFVKTFIHKNRKKIKGVVVYDDKLFGDEFGEIIEFFTARDVKILRVWDKMVSDEEIKDLEEELHGIATNSF